MLVVPYAAITNHDIRFAANYRSDQLGYICPNILPVGIGVDDNISPAIQSMVETATKRCCQSAVCPMTHNVLDAQTAGDSGCVIAAAIVDDEHLYLGDTFDSARQGGGRWADGH